MKPAIVDENHPTLYSPPSHPAVTPIVVKRHHINPFLFVVDRRSAARADRFLVAGAALSKSVDNLFFSVATKSVAVNAHVGVIIPRQGTGVSKRADKRAVDEIVGNVEVGEDVIDEVNEIC